MTVHLPTDEEPVVVEHHEEPPAEFVEPYVPSPSFDKYDRRASGARAEPRDDASPPAPPSDPDVTPKEPTNAAPAAEPAAPAAAVAGTTPGTEFVEPYVPSPSFDKYDRRASGAGSRTAAAESPADEIPKDAPPDPVEPTAVGAETEVPQLDLPLEPEAEVEQVVVDLTEEPEAALSPPVQGETVYDRELREMEERAAAERAARAKRRIDPFADPNELTYWQRHSAGLPRIEEQPD